MLASKSKGLFLELGDFSLMAAVTSSLGGTMTVEQLKEVPGRPTEESFPGKVTALFDELYGPKRSGYVMSRVAAYPKTRFLRRYTVEQLPKLKDENFLPEEASKQFKIDVAKNMMAVVSAVDGSPLNLEQAANYKELVFAGAEATEFGAIQASLLGWGIYPDRLELGSLSTIGGLQSYLKWKKISDPLLILELAPDGAHVNIVRDAQVDVCRPIPFGLDSMFPVIQQELGLKDEESARKLFNSNTFDFTEMGPVLLRRLLKELQASTGFYEVQTGQTIGHLFLPQLPRNLSWIGSALSRSLGVEILHVDFAGWLRSLGLSPGPGVQLEGLDGRWVGLFSLMGDYNSNAGSK